MIRDRRGSELLLGLDVGTSSTKGVLARLDGEVVASAERFHRVSSPRPGWAEHDAEEVWWREFKEVCAGLLEGSTAGLLPSVSAASALAS